MDFDDKKASIVKDGVTARAEEFSEGKVSVQVGANSKQSMSIEIGDMRAQALKITNDKGKGLSVKDAESANEAINCIWCSFKCSIISKS